MTRRTGKVLTDRHANEYCVRPKKWSKKAKSFKHRLQAGLKRTEEDFSVQKQKHAVQEHARLDSFNTDVSSKTRLIRKAQKAAIRGNRLENEITMDWSTNKRQKNCHRDGRSQKQTACKMIIIVKLEYMGMTNNRRAKHFICWQRSKEQDNKG